MTEQSQADERLDRLEAKVDELIYLVRTGGKDSRVLEHVPAWRGPDCDAECAFTGTPVPEKKLVKHHGLLVHPGVKAFAEARGIRDLNKALDIDVPQDYLVVPYEVIFREVYRPPSVIRWDPSILHRVSRPGLMYLANHMGMSAKLAEAGHPDADFRSQSNEWVRAALKAIYTNSAIEDPRQVVPRGSRIKKPPVQEARPSGNAEEGPAKAVAPRKQSKKKAAKAKPKATSTSSAKRTSKKKAAKKGQPFPKAATKKRSGKKKAVKVAVPRKTTKKRKSSKKKKSAKAKAKGKSK